MLWYSVLKQKQYVGTALPRPALVVVARERWMAAVGPEGQKIRANNGYALILYFSRGVGTRPWP